MNVPAHEVGPKRFDLHSIGTFIRNYWSDYVLLVIVATIIIISDQLAKVWVRSHIPLGGDWLPSQFSWLMPYARIRYWYNSGAAFGIFKNGNLVFMVLAVIVAFIILYYFPRVARKDWWLRIALMLQFSGAVGNLVDRIQFGHVTDFISVGNFAIFNIADSSISVGVAILVLGVWINDRAEKQHKADQTTPSPSNSQEEQALSPKDEAKSG